MDTAHRVTPRSTSTARASTTVGDTGGTYVNATAKAPTFADDRRADPPRTYGGVDLVAQLEDRSTSATGPIIGRIDSSLPADYAN